MSHSNTSTAVKICSTCKQGLGVGDFTLQASRPDGLSRQCRQCQREYRERYKSGEGIRRHPANVYTKMVPLTVRQTQDALRILAGPVAAPVELPPLPRPFSQPVVPSRHPREVIRQTEPFPEATGADLDAQWAGVDGSTEDWYHIGMSLAQWDISRRISTQLFQP